MASFVGTIETVRDVVLVLEAIDRGILQLVHKRIERDKVMAGNVYVYKSNSGIIRWTDGLKWSPSRIYNIYLVYRHQESNLKKKTVSVSYKGTIWHMVIYFDDNALATPSDLFDFSVDRYKIIPILKKKKKCIEAVTSFDCDSLEVNFSQIHLPAITGLLTSFPGSYLG
ncbi:hypothetical protein HK103_005343 [Boothiomyces macroporosus]|uniref:Uncharacterized protein n=1 Tax=Boothiomyces macroporosus TaxID=261099 RepID=A0AAD5ULW4_9FUNG|nr:hypothetical protein HK103_005343 [Boothiomyces macroporosus]